MASLEIGNYIHWRRYNYYRFGISQKGGGVSLSASIKSQHAELLNAINGLSSPNVAQLEQFLNNLRETGNLARENDTQSLTQLENNYTNLLYNKLGNLSARAKFDNADFIRTSNPYFDVLNRYKGLIGKNQTKGTQIGTLQKISKQIQDVLNSMKDLVGGKKKTNQWLQDKQKLETIQQQLNQLLLQHQGKSEFVTISHNTEVNGVSLKQILKTYNGLLRLAKEPSQTDLGMAAEAQVALLGSLIEQGAVKSTNEIIQQHIVGAQNATTKITFNPKSPVFNALKEEIKFSNADAVSGTITVNSPQTVDVQFKMLDLEQGEMQKINASVKSYSNISNPYGHIKILGGTTLFNMLGLVTQEFANHYLNFLAKHTDINAERSIMNTMGFAQAEETMKRSLLTRGLVGYRGAKGDSGAGMANTFIVNDRSSKKFRVFSIKDLAQTAWNDISNFVKVDGLPGYESLSNQFEQAGPEVRIAKLLAQTHAIKLDVALSNTIFKNIK